MFEDLKEKYRLSLPDKRRSLLALVEQLKVGLSEAEPLLRALAHGLHGSGSTFGFPEITEAARLVEHAPRAELGTAIQRLLLALDRVIALPAAGPANAMAAASATAAAEAPGARKVLIAEDDELLADVVKHRLRREGLVLTHVVNGADALRVADSEPFALIILDVKMPVVDGFEVLSKLRAAPATAQTPILMLTAMGSEKDVVRGYDLGANDYMLKPFSPAELMAKVRRHLKLG